MDWDRVIERNRAALKRILAMLIAMARDGAPVLPRRVHRAVLRLLRPAEAATRRLIVIVARDIVAPPPSARGCRPRRASLFVRHGRGTGIVLPRGMAAGLRPAPPTPRRLALPLLDPLPRGGCRHARYRGPGSSGVPRILFPGVTEPFPVAAWHSPSPDDPLDAARLALRIDALASALDDLPGQARRFARWRARRDAHLAAAREAETAVPLGRHSPLRPGRPPGFSRRGQGRDGEMSEVLADLQYFARVAQRPPDTS